MKRPGLVYGAAVAVATGGTLAAGAALAPERFGSVLAGALVGAGFQLLLFALAAAALPEKRFAAYGIGMLGRMLLVAVAALVVVPAAKLAAAPFLFSLLAVLFATTLIEPVVHAAGTRKPTG